ncbi:hypothetical protein [Bradyrhizobium sp. Mp27]|uniref:hypothetical protein n=1 Tax=Bradyrhizobium sp. Mp27 TaxID=3042157 RepID=UPI00248CAE0B|nr:hypothetical protein [Bradyrhizobium sp. Mp27]MDI2073039.1 hypothetical protein [Bradyrhizobium sp. Mp27]
MSVGSRLFFPPKSHLKDKAARLSRFPALRLEDLIGHRLKDPKTQVTAELVEEIRRRTEDQLNQILEQLGVDPQHPDKWQRAFQELAAIHHGVGIISWVRPRPPNRNAAKKSTRDLDQLLYSYVTELKEQGKSLPEALETIARDVEKCALLKVSASSRSQRPDVELKVEALRKRYRRIAKMAPPGSWLAAVTGTYPIYGSEKDQARHTRILLATMPDFVPSGKSSPSKKP